LTEADGINVLSGVLNGIEPAAVFRFFEEVSAIPRGSGDEAAIAAYLEGFAWARGLWVYRDKHNNVLIRKPGSRGREGEPPVIIQGHSDMVCEKNADIRHDFLKDPIELYTDGDLIRARGTTLGADDGVALAFALALLDGGPACDPPFSHPPFSHPPIEALFTTDEETGMDGALNFDYGLLRAKRLINLDSEEEGRFMVSCSGGARVDLKIPVTRRMIPDGRAAFEISVKSLRGGHSGMDIHKERGNANRLMARVLNVVLFDTEKSVEGGVLCGVEGGSMDNAIPRECRALISIENETEIQRLLEIVKRYDAIFKNEYRVSDPLVEVSAKELPALPAGRAGISQETAASAVRALLTLPCGVLGMSLDIPGLVETSNNIGVVKLVKENLDKDSNEYIVITCAARSSVATRMEFVKSQIKAVAEAVGAAVSARGEYPGWEYSPVSPMREAALECYRELSGKAGETAAVHAGIECGIFAERIAGLDAVSFGPNIHGVHSPDECLEIASTQRAWKLLLRILARI